MERYCSTGQSPQWAVVPVEEEEEEEEEEEDILSLYVVKYLMTLSDAKIIAFRSP
jgi:hypothetical protein